ncbi:MAG TPA: tetratricopeptide repeat protein, partial [Pyrinomonadaceae bacterium]
MTQSLINQYPPTDPLIRAQRSSERGDLEGAQKLLVELIEGETETILSERGVQARATLAEVYEGLGLFEQAGEVLSAYDVHALDELPPHARGLLLLATGSRAYWQNDFPRSVTMLNRARDILEPLGDAPNLARVLHCLGRAYWAMDELALAREYYEFAIEWGRRSQRDRALAITYMNLGLVARHEGDVDEAGMCYRRALRLLRNTTDETTRARLQINLGVMHLWQGNFYEATNSLQRALEHLSNSQSSRLIGVVHNNLAVASIYTGEWAA